MGQELGPDFETIYCSASNIPYRHVWKRDSVGVGSDSPDCRWPQPMSILRSVVDVQWPPSGFARAMHSPQLVVDMSRRVLGCTHGHDAAFHGFRPRLPAEWSSFGCALALSIDRSMELFPFSFPFSLLNAIPFRTKSPRNEATSLFPSMFLHNPCLPVVSCAFSIGKKKYVNPRSLTCGDYNGGSCEVLPDGKQGCRRT